MPFVKIAIFSLVLGLLSFSKVFAVQNTGFIFKSVESIQLSNCKHETIQFLQQSCTDDQKELRVSGYSLKGRGLRMYLQIVGSKDSSFSLNELFQLINSCNNKKVQITMNGKSDFNEDIDSFSDSFSYGFSISQISKIACFK